MRELVERVAALRDTHDRSISVGISGVDCAGKSTLAETLRHELAPAVVVAGDELTRPTRERYRDPDEGLSYYRDSFDYAQVFDALLPFVAAGGAGEIPWRVTDLGTRRLAHVTWSEWAEPTVCASATRPVTCPGRRCIWRATTRARRQTSSTRSRGARAGRSGCRASRRPAAAGRGARRARPR